MKRCWDQRANKSEQAIAQLPYAVVPLPASETTSVSLLHHYWDLAQGLSAGIVVPEATDKVRGWVMGHGGRSPLLAA